MLLLLRLFHCLSWATLTPCLVAIPESVSPLLTVYVPVADVLPEPDVLPDEFPDEFPDELPDDEEDTPPL